MKELLLKKIGEKSIKVGVVGLGYVGLPLAVEKAKAGFVTVGFDIQKEKVDMVNRGHNYIGDVVDSDLDDLVKKGMLSATTDFGFVGEMDFIAICVPTPLDAHQQPDISYVKTSAESISKYLKKNTMVVLESTTYPGTTQELVKPILEEGSKLKCGEDFYLGFSPERVDPGNLIYKTKNTPKVVGGVGKLWFYIHDADIMAARAYMPSVKSPSNVPDGCASIQFEIYFNGRHGGAPGEGAAVADCLAALEKLGVAGRGDVLFTDYRVLPYGNIIGLKQTEKDLPGILSWLKEVGITPVGRFGRWEYLWSDQAFLSGYHAGIKGKG